MTTPSPEVLGAVSGIDDDLMILGVGGKMGPTLGELLVRAGARSVIGVSRFSQPGNRDALEAAGVETIKCDLLDDGALETLPETRHIFLMAGFKFGSTANEPYTWAMNAQLPARVLQRFPKSRIVYVSSGNVYRFGDVRGNGGTSAPDLASQPIQFIPRELCCNSVHLQRQLVTLLPHLQSLEVPRRHPRAPVTHSHGRRLDI